MAYWRPQLAESTTVKRDYSILDHLSEGVQVMDREWRYVYVNDRVVAQSSYTREQLIGQTFFEMYPGVEQTQLYAALRSTMDDGEQVRVDNDFTFPDGTKRYFQLRAYPVPEGILIFSLDMTEETRRQLIAEDHQSELEELVRQRTAELSARNQELVQLTYLVSHDLRSPLTTMVGNAELLRLRAAAQLDERGLAHLDRIESSARRLGDIVDGMLRHARLGVQAEPEDVDTKALLRDIRDDLEAPLQATGGVLEFDDLPVLRGHMAELRTLFQNLVENGLKYHRAGVPPRVKVRAERQDEGTWRFAVHDNGIGIALTDQARVFDMFSRLRERGDVEGSGLGLAHCEKVVGLHGGRIWIESVPGEGTTFLFTCRQQDQAAD